MATENRHPFCVNRPLEFKPAAKHTLALLEHVLCADSPGGLLTQLGDNELRSLLRVSKTARAIAVESLIARARANSEPLRLAYSLNQAHASLAELQHHPRLLHLYNEGTALWLRNNLACGNVDIYTHFRSHLFGDQPTDHDIIATCRKGYVALLHLWRKSLMQLQRTILRECFNCACEKGHLQVAQWLHNAFNFTLEDARASQNCALRFACSHGHFALARWLCTTFDLTSEDVRASHNYAFRYACARGHLAVAQWLQNAFKLTREDARACDNFALRFACYHGHFAVARWLCAAFDLTSEDVRAGDNAAFRYACAHRNLAVARWLHEAFKLTSEDALACDNYALRHACLYGHLAIAHTCENDALRIAHMRGHRLVAQWLLSTFALTGKDM